MSKGEQTFRITLSGKQTEKSLLCLEPSVVTRLFVSGFYNCFCTTILFVIQNIILFKNITNSYYWSIYLQSVIADHLLIWTLFLFAIILEI